MIGDSPLIQTGFGRVNAIAAKRFQEAGWDVASVAGLTEEPPEDDKGIEIFVPTQKHDVLGVGDIMSVAEKCKPDILYSTADPGSVAALAMGAPDMPYFGYIPIEGEPISNRIWKTVLSTLDYMTVSNYGVNVVKNELGKDIDFAYHGVDHDVFKVYPGLRDDVRKQMHWEDKFVINCTATNVRRKQIPRLIEAVAKLKYEYHQKDIVLYIHTVPFQNHWLEGWNLMDIVRMYQVEKEVFFHPLMAKKGASVPIFTGNPQMPGVIDMYHASDLFVLPSQVEGFGLPIAEAMACGVPVLVTQYAAGWEVAQPAGKGIPVNDWEVHKSGTVYANVNTSLLAKEILRLKRNPKERIRMAQRGLERVRDFDWKVFTDKLIPSVEEAYDAYSSRSANQEKEDKRDKPEEEAQERLREGETQDGPAESDNLFEG